MFEATLSLSQPQQLLTLFGACDQNLRLVCEALSVSITHRNGQLRVFGDEKEVAQATHVLEQMRGLVERQDALSREEVVEVLSHVTGDWSNAEMQVEVFQPSQQVRARTPGQARYMQAIRDYELVFAVGPAGTGKTHLAVAMAVEALKQQRIKKIVLVRPAVEAGESLGFLPGDFQAKINPYLRPLLDALHAMIDHDQIRQFMEQEVIEVIPLAYMRGRTLNEAFIILDEAQNATVSQMKMFLTRMGEGSRIVASGDITQIDLPPTSRSGLTDAVSRLKNIDGIARVTLTGNDIVRHRLVQEIVEAYETASRPSRSSSLRRK
ncbi:MAG TPA: PhoH family protein [Planctomycetaceae bacterium]|nr:PhoH family protein [Planctomycetaceae bacterium]